MTLYIDTDDERILFDSEKAPLLYEGTEINLTGRTLSLYDARYAVVDGTIGSASEPCKVIVFTDPFTGITLHVPVSFQVADDLAAGLKSPKGRFRKLFPGA